jgi:hypothetical protein
VSEETNEVIRRAKAYSANRRRHGRLHAEYMAVLDLATLLDRAEEAQARAEEDLNQAKADLEASDALARSHAEDLKKARAKAKPAPEMDTAEQPRPSRKKG